MILIDAIYINNGGAKILLDLLIYEIYNKKIPVQFLLDDRIKKQYNSQIFIKNPIYIKAGFISRFLYYRKNHKKFSLVLAIGNVPPPMKLQITVYTYLHNVLYLEEKKYLNLYNLYLIKIKLIYIKSLIKNCDFWIVQTNLVKEKLVKNFNLHHNSIFTIPFYKNTHFINKFNINKINHGNVQYLYVSNGETYKNHKRLFEAFHKFSLNKSNVELLVTISKDYKKLLTIIGKYINLGVRITNLGSLNTDEIESLYTTVNIVVFPSLLESFGLGLIEAAQYGLPIIASNYNYVNEVIQPSHVFNPLSTISIIESLENSYINKLKPSTLVVENKMNELINILNFKKNE